MFVCQRCSANFDNKTSLKRHLSRQDIPCDLFCMKCGEYVKSRHLFIKYHINTVCEPLKHLQPISNIDDKSDADSDANADSNIKPPSNDSPIKIYPLEMDNELILGIHKNSLIELLSNSFNSNLNNVIIQIVQLFYSNQNYPQHLNIIDSDTTDTTYKIYNGIRYMNDVMVKKMRNHRVLQIVLVHLNELIDDDDDDNIDSIKHYVNDTLMPHLINTYFLNYNVIESELQKLWQSNKQFVENRTIVPLEKMTKESLIRQLNQFYENEKTIAKIFITNYTKNTAKSVKEIINKIEGFS